MTININNVRKQACLAYDRLINKLNTSIKENDGQIVLDPDDIERDVNALRQYISAMAMTYFEGDDDFKDVFDELYPEDKCMAVFNEDDE